MQTLKDRHVTLRR